MTDLFLELIQVALGVKTCLSHTPSEKEWNELYLLCQTQSISAFVFTALDRLSESGQKPPMALLYDWIGQSEQVKVQNALMNKEAARLTSLFEQAGHQTAILKGQANARLYTQPWGRQPGDIDIWVDGGKEKAVESVRKLGLSDEKATTTYHHVHLKQNGIAIEVHFRPSSGNYNPFSNKRLQTFLEHEIYNRILTVEEGFQVPSLRFALVMQLAHIQRHLISEGVGMRQIIDYYYLLRSDVGNERDGVFYRLGSFGLNHMAEALMWLLHEKLGMQEDYLIAPMDEKRGRMLLQAVMEGGNFGFYHSYRQKGGTWERIAGKHRQRLQLMEFDASEAIWGELWAVYYFFARLPERIKKRKWSLE